jgi:hypothetical protein
MALSECRDLGPSLRAVDEQAAPRLAPVDDVLPHGQGLEQFEGLMHHADALGDGVER